MQQCTHEISSSVRRHELSAQIKKQKILQEKMRRSCSWWAVFI